MGRDTLDEAGYGRMNEGMRPAGVASAMSRSARATESSQAGPMCQRAVCCMAGTAFPTATEFGEWEIRLGLLSASQKQQTS